MAVHSLPKISADRFDYEAASRHPWRHSLEPKSGLHGSTPFRLRSGFETLRTLQTFAPVSDGELLKFAALGFERRVEQGRTILPGGGDRSLPQLALILEGEAQLAWGNGPEELLLRLLEPGDLLGEVEMFDGGMFRERYDGRLACGSTVVRAHTTLRLMEWDRENVREALRRWPDVALCLLGGMARRQRALQHRVAGICNQRAPRRLARTLNALAEERGLLQRDPAGRYRLLVRDPPSGLQLAELAGMARETVSRLLAEWERRGWIGGRRGGGSLILDREQLARLAGAEEGRVWDKNGDAGTEKTENPAILR